MQSDTLRSIRIFFLSYKLAKDISTWKKRKDTTVYTRYSTVQCVCVCVCMQVTRSNKSPVGELGIID